MARYELITKTALDETIEHIENAKTAITFAFADNAELALQAVDQLDIAITIIRTSRTACNVRPETD